MVLPVPPHYLRDGTGKREKISGIIHQLEYTVSKDNHHILPGVDLSPDVFDQ